MFASSAIPASASWPTLSETSPTSSPRTSGIMSGRGTTYECPLRVSGPPDTPDG
jgi:hypothetical protein